MAKITNKWLANPGGLSRVKEIPSGVIDGVNKNFVLTQQPKAIEYLDVYLNGLNDTDYSVVLATKTITFTIAPALGQIVTASYFI